MKFSKQWEEKYSLGLKVSEAVCLNKIERTALGERFALLFEEAFGTRLILAEYFLPMKPMYLRLYVDSISSFSADDLRWKPESRGYETSKLLQHKILSLLQRAVGGEEDPDLLQFLSTAEVSIAEFAKTAQSVFFGYHISSLNEAVRAAFASLDVRLFFVIERAGSYDIVFRSESALREAQRRGKISRICDAVKAFCLEKDKIGIFEDGGYLPARVTDWETLRREGKLMGLLRNNTWFTTF